MPNILLEIEENVYTQNLLSFSGLLEPYVHWLLKQLVAQCSCFNSPLLLKKYNFVTQQL
jgi:hypothetical protein